MLFNSTNWWQYNSPSGDVTLVQGATRQSNRYSDAAFIVYGPPFCPGGGPWNDLYSDARVKDVLGEYKNGLSAIKQVRPVRYKFKGNVHELAPKDRPEHQSAPHYKAVEDGREFIGLVAQDVEAAMPEMVKKKTGYIDDKRIDDLRELNANALIYALVNSCKELAARVEALERSR
jgi:hypothetical protein